MERIILTSGNLEATILGNRQLVSLKDGDHEFMHRGGDPDYPDEVKIWPHSEFLMGPIVGPAKDGIVHLAGADYRLDRHGFLRHVTYTPMSHGRDTASFEFRYEAGRPIPSTTGSESFSFPYSFSIERHYTLLGNGLLLDFSVNNDTDIAMPFEIGWHPGFNAPDSQRDHDIWVDDERLKFSEICRAGSEVRKYDACTSYFYSGSRKVSVGSNLPKKMTWRKPGSSIYGDEPVNHLPREDQLHFVDGTLMEPRTMEDCWVRLTITRDR